MEAAREQQTEEINRLLKRYGIGKKPLARLLGWGETTILRYLEGDSPTPEYANRLKELADNPLYYYRLLEENGQRLTGVAYRKSREAVFRTLSESRLFLAAQYLINRLDGDSSPLRTVFVLYYAQAFSLGLYNRYLFEEDCVLTKEKALPYADVYDALKRHAAFCVKLPESLFAPLDTKLLDAVSDILSLYGPRLLQQLFQWERAHLRIIKSKDGGRILKKDAMHDYYERAVKQYRIEKPADIARYLKERCKAIVQKYETFSPDGAADKKALPDVNRPAPNRPRG